MSALGPEAGVSELKAALSSGALSAEALTRRTLERIRAVDGPVNAWLRLADDAALADAVDVDRRRAAGERLGPLAG
ncbi:MAG: hypothetical protein VX938_04625, partial [Myxococcota bacterium]|nr:hypothetical protein [Myxococcota bacterium]